MSFTQFNFSQQIQKNISSCGYIHPTPIQEQAIPQIITGRDCVGLAQTGTGKTAAFVLPIVHRLLSREGKGKRAVVIAPTRELAEQIHQNVLELAHETGLRSVVVYGGVGKQPQLKGLRGGAEIVVACPGRLLDLLSEPGVSMKNVGTLVLDEADHMFDQGFLPDIKRIIQRLPEKRQNLIFSATMPREIRRLIENILVDPMKVQVDHEVPADTIEHIVYKVPQNRKMVFLEKLLQEENIVTSVIFTRTKFKAKKLAVQLAKKGHDAVALQGNMSQQKRKIAMDGFRDGTFNILVATDIAARGIDVSDISHVVNFDVPDTAETYTHRTGRTGRAKKHGEAITFATQDDMKMIRLVERNLGKKMVMETVDVESLPQPVVPQQPGRKVRGQGNRKKKTESKASSQKRSASKRNSRKKAKRSHNSASGVVG